MKYLFAFALLLVIGCSKQQPKATEEGTTTPVIIKKTQPATDSIFLTKPQTYSVTGDFDGDGKQDTLTAI
jgi:hypothetical protein